MGKLDGRTAIVTGGTEGIGAAVARLFAGEGARLVLVARRAPSGTVLATPDPGNEDLRFVAGDVRVPDTAREAVAVALSSFGRLDIVVNNAGLDARGGVLDADIDTYRDVFDVNVLGSLLMIQAAAAHLREHSGAIVNVAARSALQAVAGKSMYGAAKAAVLSLTRTAALELAPGIRVNAVAPGPTETPLLEAVLARTPDPSSARRDMIDGVPLRRLSTAAEVAQAILFLACDDAHGITGVTLPVDGGLSA